MANNNHKTRNLLLISCSQRKKGVMGKVKAWELYDGVIFRMLKKIEREIGLPDNLDILILSAKYGFIRPSERIGYYDYRLAADDIKIKRDFILSGLKIKCKSTYSRVLICLGKDYLKSIEGFNKCFPNQTKMHYIKGGIGLKMAKVKGWVERLNALRKR